MTESSYMVEIGKRILADREDLGLSKAAVAKFLDVSPSSIDNWEKGIATIGAPTHARLKAYFKEQRRLKGLPPAVSA